MTLKAILMVDIDDFKKHNDIFGHFAGDEALRKVGQSFNKIAEENKLFAARFGGEEFVFLIYENNLKSTEEIGDIIINKVRELNITAPYSQYDIVTVSVGATNTNSITPYMTSLNEADESLYKAKTSGKSKLVVNN